MLLSKVSLEQRETAVEDPQSRYTYAGLLEVSSLRSVYHSHSNGLSAHATVSTVIAMQL